MPRLILALRFGKALAKVSANHEFTFNEPSRNGDTRF
jgi:hypothetical protein